MTDSTHLLGKTFQCECGKRHEVPVRQVVYSPDAIRRVPDFLSQHASARCVTLVADARTYGVAGETTENELRANGWDVQACLIPDPPHGDPICDEATREAVQRKLDPRSDFVVAVGSGVISDLCKWVSTETHIPYVVVATAASMNGYASSNIAPVIKGVKRVISGTPPGAVFAVPSVIENAPYELTTAGLGDVLAKRISSTDWRISGMLFGDYYCPLCAHLIREFEPAYADHPDKLRRKDAPAIHALFDGLVYSGIAMTMAGISSPASGGEHFISHVLDMTSTLDGVPHDYHGRQVGVGTIFAAAVYERLLRLESPEFVERAEETDPEFWKSLTAVVEEEHARKRVKAGRAVRKLGEPGVWDSVRQTIVDAGVSASEIKRCLKEAGAAHCIEHIRCRRERFADAVRHCYQIRERYCVIDLARAAGVLPSATDEIIDEYLMG